MIIETAIESDYLTALIFQLVRTSWAWSGSTASSFRDSGSACTLAQAE